jgi:hypothetical protein
MRKLIFALAFLMLVAPASAHQLKVYTVMVNSEGVYPADIPNGSLREGDSVWFWMKDSSENTTLIIELEKDDSKIQSPVLSYACELKENGTEKVDESCETRFDFKFNQENTSGLWNIAFMKYVNETLTETSSGTVVIGQDIHEEHTVIVSKTTTKQSIYEPVLVGAIVLFVGMVLVILNKNQSHNSEEE